jgi:hypothetical protein
LREEFKRVTGSLPHHAASSSTTPATSSSTSSSLSGSATTKQDETTLRTKLADAGSDLRRSFFASSLLFVSEFDGSLLGCYCF